MNTATTATTATTDRDDAAATLCQMLGITGPGAYAMREPDGRCMVWASEVDAQDDDGAKAVYRSRGPITDAAWLAITRLAWVDEYEG